MKKILIICSAGMSSSLMAEKTNAYLHKNAYQIQIDAVSVNEGKELLAGGNYDLYLISSQTRMYLDSFEKIGDTINRRVILIPFQAYIPVQTGIEALGNLILENISRDDENL